MKTNIGAIHLNLRGTQTKPTEIKLINDSSDDNECIIEWMCLT